jgi:uncharacterized protein (TIGR02598 family)
MLSAMTPRTRIQAFSLIEVVLAIGIFAISILAIVGLMGTGLTSVENSSNSFAIANITRSLRANFETTAYTNVINAGAAQTLAASYYTSSGYLTNASDPAYYTVSCTPAMTYQGATTNSLMSSPNAAVIAVSVLYPYPINTQTNTFSLLLAH